MLEARGETGRNKVKPQDQMTPQARDFRTVAESRKHRHTGGTRQQQQQQYQQGTERSSKGTTTRPCVGNCRGLRKITTPPPAELIITSILHSRPPRGGIGKEEARCPDQTPGGTTTAPDHCSLLTRCIAVVARAACLLPRVTRHRIYLLHNDNNSSSI